MSSVQECAICEEETGSTGEPLRWHRAPSGDRLLAHHSCWLRETAAVQAEREGRK